MLQPGDLIKNTARESFKTNPIARKLRFLDPLRMKKIGRIMTERKSLLNSLKRNETTNSLGSDKFHMIMKFRGTEAKIVQETIEGIIKGTNIPQIGTRDLWADMLVTIASSVDVGRRTQIFADLLSSKKKLNIGLNETIDKALGQIEKFDPEVRKRAEDEDFFRGQIMDVEGDVIEDTLSHLF